VAKPLALGAKLRLGAGLQPFRVVDERTELGDALLTRGRAVPQVVEPPSRSRDLSPGDSRLGAPHSVFRIRVEDGELERRTREPALLELTRHRDRPFRRRRHVLARRRTSPRIGARAAVPEDAAREHDAGLVLRPQLGEHVRRLAVELDLDVRLRRGRPDHRRVGACPEQEPDRLGEDRLPGPGLARDRIQTQCEVELRLADEDEILDAQAAEHRTPDGTAGRWTARMAGMTRWLLAGGFVVAGLPFTGLVGSGVRYALRSHDPDALPSWYGWIFALCALVVALLFAGAVLAVAVRVPTWTLLFRATAVALPLVALASLGSPPLIAGAAALLLAAWVLRRREGATPPRAAGGT